MKDAKKRGFTLVELIVVLVILSIIMAIAVPFFVNYWRRAEFRKNESNAKTIYLAAESKLTYYLIVHQVSGRTFRSKSRPRGL